MTDWDKRYSELEETKSHLISAMGIGQLSETERDAVLQVIFGIEDRMNHAADMAEAEERRSRNADTDAQVRGL